MTNYTKTTDFAAKDSLPSGNAAKIVKGSEIDTEFNNIATASATKANANNAALTGTTTVQTLDISGNVDVDGTLETDALSLNGVTVTSTAAELNYVDGVTSNVQTQLNTKAPLASPTFTGTVTAAALTVDTTTLVVDATNNRVGIGTSSPITLDGNAAPGLTISSNGPYVLLQDANNADKVRYMSNNTGELQFGIVGDDGTTGKNEHIRITSAGSVGINTSSPSAIDGADKFLAIQGSSAAGINLTAGGAYGGAGMELDSSNSLKFYTAGSEGMRIDSSGNLLVGKTSAGSSVVGQELRANGYNVFTRDGDTPLELYRKTSDGSLLNFTKDGTTSGSIGTLSGDLNIGSGDTGLDFSAGLDAIMPYNPSTNGLRDNTIDLGQSSVRFDDIYATNGTIQTSDRNEKQDIEALSDAEQRVAVAAKGLLRKFRWRSSVAENGDDARIHFGIIAQDLQAAFEAEGLDAGRYAMFTSNTWTDEETGEERTRLGVRYSELLAFIISAI